MNVKQLHKDNHFVPETYLKRWATDGGKLWSYRLLVSHANVPLWHKASPASVASQEHLYTRTLAAGPTDDLERWLDSEFESPATAAIEKVIGNQRLTPQDWRSLARFFAAQDVRTPARMVEQFGRWSELLPSIIQDELRESVARLEAMSDDEWTAQRQERPVADQLPFKVTVEENPNGDGGTIRAETALGRGLWTWSIRYLLTHTIEALYEHRWTILSPPEGLTWITSDDPVLKVNFNSLTDYTFGGGWGSEGTDLALPLGPNHLLFTQVRKKVPPRGTRMDREKAIIVRRLLAEHAHRRIFATTPDPFVVQIRPRMVDAETYEREATEWRRWHIEQTAAEEQLIQGRETNDRQAPT